MNEIKTWRERIPFGADDLIEDYMQAEIDELRAALADAERDAARYRWLLSNCSYSYAMQPDSPAEHGIEYQWVQGTYEERNLDISGSIDAAINAIREGEKS